MIKTTSKRQKLQFAVYMLVAYLLTYSIERSAAKAGDSKLFQSAAWPITFFVWYGFLFTVVYLIFRKRPLWLILLAGAIIGPLIELVLFRHFILITDLGYGIMFAIPFLIARLLVKNGT